MTKRDEIYLVPKPLVSDFAFGSETAAVFDDMLDRSVPFYSEIQRMITELVADFAVDGSNVYDLGCSTCATFRRLAELDRDVTFVGIDDLQRRDLHEGLDIHDASVVILCLTLQFVRPLHRERVMKTIYDGMRPQGCLIVVEKVLAEETLMNRFFIKHYYDMKRRNGYSDIEIAQKREALENVLIPYRLDENVALMKEAGFHQPEIFFKWYNFSGLVAVK